MMTKKFAAMAILAAAGAVLEPSSATAQVTYTNSNGDFLLGFRQVGSTNSILLDIGPISSFTSVQNFNLGNVTSILSTQFGAGWATDQNVFFSLAATTRPGDATRTNYMTSPETTGGAEAVPWNRLTSTNSLTLQNKVIAMGNAYNGFSAQQAAGNSAVVEPNTTADAYLNYMPGGTSDAGHANGNIAFGFFNPTTEGNFGNGTGGITLDLIQLVPGAGAGVDLGDFTINGNTLTFTPDSFEAVPEPSTWAMAVLGILGLVIIRVRAMRAEKQS
jgi:hypothetical protein